MNTIPTRTPVPFLSSLVNSMRASYLRWQLDHVEKDIEVYSMNEIIARGRADELRCQLARLGAL